METRKSFCGPDRRRLLQTTACGFGSLAMRGLLTEQTYAAGVTPSMIAQPHSVPRAARVIFLFIQGGPSQPDLFDPKPLIAEKHGQTISPGANEHKLSVGVDKYLALKPVAPIRPRGQCGMLMSDLLPHLATVADDLCLLRGMHTDNEAHAPATLQLHTGASVDVRPSMGAWFSYGLGSENRNLPGFITIQPDSDVRTYGSGFLPAAHQGTPVNITTNPKDSAIRYLLDSETTPQQQRRRLDLIQRMNHRLIERTSGDSQMNGMIESFEMAFRMQAATPGLIDLSGEPKSVQDLYGIGTPTTDRNGRACLLARRMSEAGVRFVQVTLGGWDHHGNIREALPGSCRSSDQPVAALLKDLKARGMLEDTLVVWSGEFGRTPWSQDLSGTSPIDTHGREHQPEGYCAWMAGAGVRAGMTYGSTDDFGYRAIDGKVHLHDLHATMLHLMGIQHTQLTYRHAGRDYRLTDVSGRVVSEVLS
jgi:hypothetical protein